MLQPVVTVFCCLVLLWTLADVTAAQDTSDAPDKATLTGTSSFNSDLIPDIEITFLCTSATPDRFVTRIEDGGEIEWPVTVSVAQSNFCQVYAVAPRGFSIAYVAGGDATSKADENGCQYAEVANTQLNHCHITVTQDHVPLTVYKKWVGATGEEGDVAVMLACDNGVSESPKFINQGLPATWQLSDIPPQGLVCSVSESPDESFISDETDCQELLLVPGRGEACTMVNTKVVKRIEMLNRYGKVIMILVMLTAGLTAVRRYV